MFFYVLIIPVLVASGSMIFYLLRTKRSDKNLFELRQKERAILGSLRAKAADMSPAAYNALRDQLIAIDSSLNNCLS